MARCLRCKAGNEWIEGDAKSVPPLTQRQIDVLIAAAEFIKAGEWPWDNRQPAILDRAIEKLHEMLEGSHD